MSLLLQNFPFSVCATNNKQIYHSWEALVESMGSEVPSTVPHLHSMSMWSILCIDHIRHLVCIECVIFWYPIHTCYVWDQAVQQEKNFRWDWCILYWNIFFNFSCDIEFKFTLPNIQSGRWCCSSDVRISSWVNPELLIILILVWIVCSTYRKGEILMQKWHVTSQFVYCYMPY